MLADDANGLEAHLGIERQAFLRRIQHDLPRTDLGKHGCHQSPPAPSALPRARDDDHAQRRMVVPKRPPQNGPDHVLSIQRDETVAQLEQEGPVLGTVRPAHGGREPVGRHEMSGLHTSDRNWAIGQGESPPMECPEDAMRVALALAHAAKSRFRSNGVQPNTTE